MIELTLPPVFVITLNQAFVKLFVGNRFLKEVFIFQHSIHLSSVMIEALHLIDEGCVIDVFPSLVTAEESAFAGLVAGVIFEGWRSDVLHEDNERIGGNRIKALHVLADVLSVIEELFIVFGVLVEDLNHFLHIVNDHHSELSSVVSLLFFFEEVGCTEGKNDGQGSSDEGHQQLFSPVSVLDSLPFGHL